MTKEAKKNIFPAFGRVLTEGKSRPLHVGFIIIAVDKIVMVAFAQLFRSLAVWQRISLSINLLLKFVALFAAIYITMCLRTSLKTNCWRLCFSCVCMCGIQMSKYFDKIEWNLTDTITKVHFPPLLLYTTIGSNVINIIKWVFFTFHLIKWCDNSIERPLVGAKWNKWCCFPSLHTRIYYAASSHSNKQVQTKCIYCNYICNLQFASKKKNKQHKQLHACCLVDCNTHTHTRARS